MSKANQERISAYVPEQLEIIKETQPDGTVVFKHPVGEKIQTDDMSLYELVDEWISRIRRLVSMLGDDEYDDFGVLCEVLLKDIDQQREEVFFFLENSVGQINIRTIPRRGWPYRAGRVVQASVKPPEKGGE